MNMFRNLLVLFLIVFGFALIFGQPDQWTFLDRWADAVNVLHVIITFKPFVVIACFVLALGLFMTRKIY
jgi:uncharacterized membrane protein